MTPNPLPPTHDHNQPLAEFNRRDFLKGSSAATLMTLLGGVELVMPARRVLAADASQLHGPAVKTAVIGLGPWGREIMATLAKLPEAEVVSICDTYPAMLKRGAAVAPKAEQADDYKKVLANKDVKAVVIATPTHFHKEIAIEALQAGKHVYCEAPLAHTIEDSRAIAQAAKKAGTVVFQPGLQVRSDPQRHFLLNFIRAGAMGRAIKARVQWQKKQSWRFPSANPEREKAINWRLDKEVSLGLVGEIGVHQIDAAAWFLKQLPKSVVGFGSVVHWKDGRTTADSVQTVYEFPEGVLMTFDGTLANSFDGEHEMYYGTDSAVMIRGNKAWMFKEVDSPLLGWEVYARKDIFYKETGIALIANATKLTAQGDKPVDDAPHQSTPLYYALEAFLSNVNEVSGAVEDFTATFGKADPKALAEHLAGLTRQPAATAQDGHEATVLAIKGNEAVLKSGRVEIPAEAFQI